MTVGEKCMHCEVLGEGAPSAGVVELKEAVRRDAPGASEGDHAQWPLPHLAEVLPWLFRRRSSSLRGKRRNM